MPDHRTFRQIWTSFNANIGALRSFVTEIGAFAEQQEDNWITQLSQRMATAMGSDPLEIETQWRASLPFPDSDVQISPSQMKELPDILASLREEGFKQSVQEWFETRPAEKEDFINFWNTLRSRPVAHGEILRRSALIMLVVFFESLETHILRTYYTLYPSALSQKPEDNKISLAELRELSSFDEVEGVFIIREAERIMRDSLSNRLKHYKERLKLKLAPYDKLSSDLLGLSLRRNLLVHNDGFVTNTFLGALPEEARQHTDLLPGLQLRVSPVYLHHALNAVHLYGFLLLQTGWRQWSKAERDDADKDYIQFSYDCLEHGEYDLASQLDQYAPLIGVSKRPQIVITVNHAIALREQGKHDKVRGLLKTLGNAPESADIEIALVVLRSEYDRAIEMLEKYRKLNKMGNIQRGWPLFRPLYENPRFEAVFHAV